MYHGYPCMVVLSYFSVLHNVLRGIRRGKNRMEDLVNLWESDDIKYEIKNNRKMWGWKRHYKTKY